MNRFEDGISAELVTTEPGLDPLEHRDASTVDVKRGPAVSSRLTSYTVFHIAISATSFVVFIRVEDRQDRQLF